MKIPFSINPLILKVYESSVESQSLIGEEKIKIDAQDLDWDNNEIPTLATLCVKKIAFYFDTRPRYYEVPCSDRDTLLELLSLDLDLKLAIPLLTNEYYWRRRYAKNFGTILHPKPKEWTWKSIFCEREIQRLLETALPQYKDETRIADLLQLTAPYVKRLVVSQLMMWKPMVAEENETLDASEPGDHIDFTYVLPHLPYLEEFDLIFGINNVAFDFSWKMFKVTVNDCLRLGKAILALPSLSVLRIHKSKIEDPQCQALMKSLVDNRTIVELDLSNLSIGNQGALCVAKFLSVCTSLKILNLNNNLIGEDGTVGLAYALMQEGCPPLKSLHLSLNPLGREGTVGIMRALVRCPLPAELYISAVGFEGDMIERLPQMLTVNDSLKLLDISSNFLGEIGGDNLIEAMEENSTLEFIDMRETGITEVQKRAINEILRKNRGVTMELEDLEEKTDELAEEGHKGDDEDEDDY